ncbi:MAG: hypothetical protein AAGF48_14945 [Pseudomonadota bacterium]
MKKTAKASGIVSTITLLAFSRALIRAATMAPDRMTLGQLSFFLYAGMADIGGSPKTFTEIKEIAGERINKSMHSTYKIFLDGSRRSDAKNTPGIGWLYTETDPTDNRRKLLKLTPKGQDVLNELLDATGELE